MTAQPTKQDMLPDALRNALHDAQAQVNALVLGKAQAVRFAFTALLSDGHLLIEDLPGLGKTTLAHALAATLGLGFQRVQFTSDLLPSDIVGVSVYDAQAGRLDHVLLSPALGRRLQDAAIWHSNADEAPNVRDQPANTGEPRIRPWRASDHDPAIVGLRLRSP